MLSTTPCTPPTTTTTVDVRRGGWLQMGPMGTQGLVRPYTSAPKSSWDLCQPSLHPPPLPTSPKVAHLHDLGHDHHVGALPQGGRSQRSGQRGVCSHFAAIASFHDLSCVCHGPRRVDADGALFGRGAESIRCEKGMPSIVPLLASPSLSSLVASPPHVLVCLQSYLGVCFVREREWIIYRTRL